MRRIYLVLPLLAVLLAATCPAQTGWNSHEGGLLKYRVMIRFGEEPDTLPDGWRFGRVSSVAVDAAGNVYAAQRGPHADPIVVFDAKGKYLRSWGKGLFSIPHGLRVDRNGHVWVTDTGYHIVMEFTGDGTLVRTLGTKGKPDATHDTFNKPTDVAFLANGDVLVTDGYGNSRVVKFSRDGKYLMEWGKRGKGPGEFDTPHVAVVDSHQNVYVSDRENERIQISIPTGSSCGSGPIWGPRRGWTSRPRTSCGSSRTATGKRTWPTTRWRGGSCASTSRRGRYSARWRVPGIGYRSRPTGISSWPA